MSSTGGVNITTAFGNNTKFNSKSRKGCSECKRKRVKCDEAKPVCERCRKARHADLCDYNLKLSWTEGRPFKKRKTDTEVGSSSLILHQYQRGHGSLHGGSLVGDELHASYAGQEETLPLPLDLRESQASIQGTEVGSVTKPTRDSSAIVHHRQTLQYSPSQFEDAPGDNSLDVLAREDNPTITDDTLEVADDYVESPLVTHQRTSRSPSAVPQSLSSYPLLCPSESPNAYFYLHHYSVHTATTLFPLLPQASRNSLLSVAASTPHLLSALLAISADQYGRLRGPTPSSLEIQNRASFYSRKALTGLQTAMNDPQTATTFPTISTVLALCTHDILMSGNVLGWTTHLRGAEQLLTLAIGTRPRDHSPLSPSPVTDPSILFLVKWFAALDMFTGISSLSKSLVPDGRYWSLGVSPAGGTTGTYIDDFVGFSLELMPILSRISRMARLQQRKSSLAKALGDDHYAEVGEDLDALLQDTVQNTETQLTALLSTVCAPPSADDGEDAAVGGATYSAQLAEETQLSHRLFVYAALLHLYRRVQELPKDHAKPEYATAKIIEIVGVLRPESPASIVILWPLFSAGCETDNAERRAIIKERIIEMRRWGMGNVEQALEAMEAYWESDSGERWDVFLGRRGVDLVLF